MFYLTTNFEVTLPYRIIVLDPMIPFFYTSVSNLKQVVNMSKEKQLTQSLELKNDTVLIELSKNLTDVYHKLVHHVKEQNYDFKDVQQTLVEQYGLDIPLTSTRSNSIDVVFHENLTNWQNIFDKELNIDNKLTLNNVKNMLLSFISSAKPPIEMHGDNSSIPLSLKQSQLSIYLEDNTFKEQLSALAENNVSAFELLSKIIGNDDFENGIDQNYFYGFDLSETQNLFEQDEF